MVKRLSGLGMLSLGFGRTGDRNVNLARAIGTLAKCILKGVVHDVYFVFKGDKDLFNFDWWKFNR